jgi:hypothetical protein
MRGIEGQKKLFQHRNIVCDWNGETKMEGRVQVFICS